MRESITSIPIRDVFEPKDGCPLCRLRDMLERRVVEYITGAAMMEPDVRIETNRLGFCGPHYEQMRGQRNRLGLALLLDSHLQELEKTALKGAPSRRGRKEGAAPLRDTATGSCFVCREVDAAMGRMVSNLCRLWEKDEDFRDLFEQQPALCLPHYRLLLDAAAELPKKSAAALAGAATTLCRDTLASLHAEIRHFCSMFDYRNSGENADFGTSRDAIERAIAFLTARSGT